MKTTVSPPEYLFKQSAVAANRFGVSRSQLYAKAPAEYIERTEVESATARLNAVYSSKDSRLDPVLQRLQAASLAEDSSW